MTDEEVITYLNLTKTIVKKSGERPEVNDYSTEIEWLTALDTAIDSIHNKSKAEEKQIPRKVIRKGWEEEHDTYTDHKVIFYCPSCGKEILSPCRTSTSWCQNCGQKLDWSTDITIEII